MTKSVERLSQNRVRRGNKEDAQNLINRLLGCAMDIFKEGGVRAITMRNLAARAGVSAMTPYRYFANKAALIDGLMDFVVNDLLALQSAAVVKRIDAEGRLRASIITYLDYWQSNPIRYRLIYLQFPSVAWPSNEMMGNEVLLEKIQGFLFHLTHDLAKSLGSDSSRVEDAMRVLHFILLGYLQSNLINKRTNSEIKRLRGITVEQSIESVKLVLRGTPSGGSLKIPSHFMDPDGIDTLDQVTENLFERAKLLEQMVFFDPVTSLQNRSGLDRELKALKSKNETHLALVHIKMTGYQNFYDSFGHEFTLSIVKEIIDRLNIKTPESCFIYRCFDDQFAVLLVGEEYCKLIDNFIIDINSAIEIPFNVERLCVSLPCNMGIALSYSVDDICRLPIMASSACELAVQSGSPWEFFDNILVSNIRDEIILQSDLRKAISNKELTLVYQPKVSSKTREVTGVEALLRWKHPSAGWISPVKFIPLAERYGMIRSIGQWVLEKAIAQAAQWAAEGFQLRMSINLSVHQLENDDIFHSVKKYLESNAIEAKWICLEITESAAMMNPDRVLSILGALRGLGVELSIDDFGTGQSSLSYLYTLPVNELKFDRSFVLSIENGSLPVIEASIQMAQAFGMRVVAEGVETTVERDKLIACGCNELQGYLFSKPLTPHSFSLFMNKWKNENACCL